MARPDINVLIIDDTPAAANLRRSIIKAGFKATTAANAAVALKLVESNTFTTLCIAPFVQGTRGGNILSRIRKLPDGKQLAVFGGVRDVNIWRGHKYVSPNRMEYNRDATFADWDTDEILKDLASLLTI